MTPDSARISAAGSNFRGGCFVPYLTKLAYGTTPFIAAFGLIHLTAPVLANLGGAPLASQTMILGREYYQTSFGEKYLILAPLVIHSASGLIKRLIALPTRQPRPFSSLLSLTGYVVATFLLPVHFLIHRYYPMSSSAPIHGVGPAELDFEFVKVGLQRWPWRSWALYAGLVACVGLHIVDGSTILWNSWFMTDSSKRSGKKAWSRNAKITGVLTLGMLPVLSGLWNVAKESPMIMSSLARRYEAVFSQSLLYRSIE